MKDKIVKNKIMENKDRAKSFALGLLCVLIIGAYVVSAVNVSASQEEQGDRPEGMPETDWNNYKLRLAQEAGQEGAGQEGAGEKARPEGRPQETTLDLLLEQEQERQEGVKKAKQAAAKTKKTEAELGGGKIAAPSSVINPNYSAIYAGKPVGTKPLLARSAEKAVEPFKGEVTSEQRAYFERHIEDMGDKQLLQLVAQNKVLFSQQDEIETAQYKLGMEVVALAQVRRYTAEFNEFLNELLRMTDRKALSTGIGAQLRIKIDELAPRLHEQNALLDMFKNMIEENRRVIDGEQRPRSVYERGADLYARTKHTLTAPQRYAAEQYGQLKSSASNIQNKVRSWWLRKAEQERLNPEERRISTRVELEPGVVARLLQDVTAEEQKKHESLKRHVEVARNMEKYNGDKQLALISENRLMSKKIEEKIALLETALADEQRKLLFKLQEMYEALATGTQTRQALENKLSEQAKTIVSEQASY